MGWISDTGQWERGGQTAGSSRMTGHGLDIRLEGGMMNSNERSIETRRLLLQPGFVPAEGPDAERRFKPI